MHRAGGCLSDMENELGPESPQLMMERGMSDPKAQDATSGDEHLDLDHEKAPGPAEPGEAESPRQVQGWAWVLLVVGVFSAQFLFSLDNTIVADIQPRIVEELGEIEKLTWITVAFELGAVSANLVWYGTGQSLRN